MSAERGTPPLSTGSTEALASGLSVVEAEIAPELEARRIVLREPYVGIAISGKHGVGKTDIASLLLTALQARRFSGGERFRAQKGGDRSTVGFMDRSVSVDRDLDQEQLDFFGDLSTNTPGLDESNLSHFLATEFNEAESGRKIARILITCKRDIAAGRITRRALVKWQIRRNQLDQYLLDGLLSPDEYARLGEALDVEKKKLHTDKVAKVEHAREERDVIQFNKAHPELDGINPYEEQAVWRGKKLYDKAVSTSHKTQVEAVSEILDWLVESGIADEITPSSEPGQAQSAETLTQIDTDQTERIVRREDFGSGEAGELAFQSVVAGFPCATYIDGDQTQCGNPPIGTVDVDLQADYNPFPFCSEEHADLLENQIADDLEATGRHGAIRGIGRNGFGRPYFPMSKNLNLKPPLSPLSSN